MVAKTANPRNRNEKVSEFGKRGKEKLSAGPLVKERRRPDDWRALGLPEEGIEEGIEREGRKEADIRL